jgi:hypothetical protein
MFNQRLHALLRVLVSSTSASRKKSYLSM